MGEHSSLLWWRSAPGLCRRSAPGLWWRSATGAASRGVVLVLALASCGEAGGGASAAPTVVSTPKFDRGAAPSSTTEPALAAVTPATSADSAGAAASAESAAPVASSEGPPPDAVPLPKVEVKNYGLHIGGGPNDDKTKEPIKRAVAPHFDALRACYAKEPKPAKEVTFGVEILIPRDGGVAAISGPRSGFEREVTDCMVKVFEAIEFDKPRQPMRLSYSLRFQR